MKRLIVAALIVGASGVAAAQTAVPAQLPADVGQQVRAFESTLRVAIEGAAGRLADRARQVVPDITLQFQMAPRVTSLVMPGDTGYVFLTEAPAIEATSAMFYDAFLKMSQTRVANSATPTNPATPGAAASDFKGPTQEYSAYVRQALIDSILDNARALPIKEGQTLTVIETGGEAVNPLAVAPRKLYLQIKGEDLLALRLNRIDREEAKKRISETVR